MASFIFFICSIILVITLVQAAPWPIHARHATHRTRFYKRGEVKVNSYHRKPIFKSIYHHKNSPRSLSSSSLDGNTSIPCDINATAISFVSSEQGIDKSTIRPASGRFNGQEGFVYLEQTVNGKHIVNTAANVRFDKDCTITLFGSSLIDPKSVTAENPEPNLDYEEILPKIGEILGANHTQAPGDLKYYLKDEDTLALVWPVPYRNTSTGFWVEAYISAHTGELVSLTDYAAHASYNVVPIEKQSLTAGREILVDPADSIASPDGWHVAGQSETSGRHVIAAHKSAQGIALASESSEGLVFNFDYDENKPRQSIDAAITNAFYVMNMMHDVSFRYGFTRKAHNFESDDDPNRSDPVLVSVQDPSGINNAMFNTPPTGQSPTCRLFVFNNVNPIRDSALSNDIMIHEYTHGITNRMTGGGTGRCLQRTDAAGMGEGWSDMMAAWFGQKSATVDDFYIGSYVTQEGDGGDSKPRGLRQFPYSTSPKVNPLMYSDMKGLTEPHAIGEIWANTLYNVYADLVKERGFSTKALTDPDGLEGNIVFMRIMMGGLSIQPCDPTVIQARDAIITADNTTYNGVHRCTILRAFARKGLGAGADEDFRDDTSVPSECDTTVSPSSTLSEHPTQTLSLEPQPTPPPGSMVTLPPQETQLMKPHLPVVSAPATGGGTVTVTVTVPGGG